MIQCVDIMKQIRWSCLAKNQIYMWSVKVINIADKEHLDQILYRTMQSHTESKQNTSGRQEKYVKWYLYFNHYISYGMNNSLCIYLGINICIYIYTYIYTYIYIIHFGWARDRELVPGPAPNWNVSCICIFFTSNIVVKFLGLFICIHIAYVNYMCVHLFYVKYICTYLCTYICTYICLWICTWLLEVGC